MSKKYGLGKGLGALISEGDLESTIVPEIKIDINLIKSNVEQPRKSFDEEKLSNLAQSISEHGIIQPIVINKDGEFYSIVAGERRWRAAKRLGLKEVPVVIMDLSDRDILEISLIENIQREDLNPIEEALAYQKLIKEFNLTQEELSIKVGKSRTAITNCMRLINLDARVQDYLVENVITEGHGRALLSLMNNELQHAISLRVIDEGLNVRQTEALVRSVVNNNLTQNNPEKEQIDKISPYHTQIKNKLENFFGTKVLFSNKNNKGKIEIQFYSEEDLERILEILKV